MSTAPTELARKRAEVILQVCSGQITATQGAQKLGISRKTYYEWEKRALAGMLSQLEDLPPGRPPQPKDPDKQVLEQRIAQLEQDLDVAKVTNQIMSLMQEREDPETKKNSSSLKKS